MEGPSLSGLASSHESRPASPAARLALVERDEAWKLASRAIGLARGSSGSVLLYEGTSGLGKSGLLAAVRALASGSGLTVLSAAGHEHETGFPHGVVVQLLGSELRSAPAVDTESSLARFGELHEMYLVCAELAAKAPLLIALDDADLADEESLRFLLYLIQRIEELPICIVLTAGTVPPGQAPRVLADIARHRLTASCRLQPLTEAGTARRVAKTSVSAAAQEAAEEIHHLSGGNPFVVDALATALGEAEQTNGERPTVARARGLASPGIAEWALVRADRLHPHAPRLLHAIAVLGDDCELRHACTLAVTDPEEVQSLIDSLIDVGILAPGDCLRFAQPAVGGAIEEALTHGERAATNLRAARLLQDEGEAPERVARHLLAAPRLGQAQTVETLSIAAAVALSRANPFDAVKYLRRALAEPPPREMRAQVILDLGRAEAMAGEPEAAERLTAGMAQLTETADRPDQALVSGRTLFALGRPEEALEAFEYGLGKAAELDTHTVQQLRAAHTTATWIIRGARPGGLDTQPPERADTAADRGLLALHAVEGALRGRPVVEVRRLAERALAQGALLDDDTSDGLTYYLAASALVFAGDLQMAEAALTAAVEDAQSRGSVLGFATASHARAAAILKRGRLLDAASDARHALAVERDGWRRGSGEARVVLAHTLIERGDLDAAERHLAKASAEGVDARPLRVALNSAQGRLMLFRGDADAALGYFLECGELVKEAGIANPAVAAWQADAGLATAVIGDWAEAERLIEAELSQATAFGEPSAIGRALLALGSIREPKAAVEAFESAAQVLEDSQAALDRACALVEYGAALRRLGRRRDARTPLKAGLELAESCGATMLAAKALREAKVAGARPRRSALHGRDALTARERQVATLAATGLSNKQIAEQLVVTVKTVEWHLNHSFLKLGVRSRTELKGKLGDEEPSAG